MTDTLFSDDLTPSWRERPLEVLASPLLSERPSHREECSVLAAISVTPSGAASQRAEIFALLCRHPEGLTDEQIADTLKLNPSSARPRRLELEQAGAVKRVGTGTTRSGRSAALWAVV